MSFILIGLLYIGLYCMFLFVCFLIDRGCLFPDVGYLWEFFYENYGSVQGIIYGNVAVGDRNSDLPDNFKVWL